MYLFLLMVFNNDLDKLDAVFEGFTEELYYDVNPKILINLLGLIDSKDPNWDTDLFVSFIEFLESKHSNTKVALIVRKDRSITKGIGIYFVDAKRQETRRYFK